MSSFSKALRLEVERVSLRVVVHTRRGDTKIRGRGTGRYVLAREKQQKSFDFYKSKTNTVVLFEK